MSPQCLLAAAWAAWVACTKQPPAVNRESLFAEWRVNSEVPVFGFEDGGLAVFRK